jgi:ribosomal protein S18 acetylase RimI-like enzyme
VAEGAHDSLGLVAVSSRVELQPFTADCLADAGRLLARRHARHRAVEPLLSPRYEDPTVAEAEVRKAWETEGASGAVAVADDEIVGYLLGAPKEISWGPNIWVEGAGQAVEETEHIRDLYGFAATTWVAEGRTVHYAIAPAHDRPLLDAWSRLAFGQQHMHAIREVPDAPAPAPDRVTIRRARRDDIPALAALEVALPEHQGRSPVFSAGSKPTLEDAVAEWEADFDDTSYAVFVAEADDVVVGSAVGCSIEKSGSHVGLTRPDSAGFLGFAAVFPQYRGLGAGRALGETVEWWATEAGYPSIVTDWRVTNLLSSRTWPRIGFRNTFVRLHRVVGY